MQDADSLLITPVEISSHVIAVNGEIWQPRLDGDL